MSNNRPETTADVLSQEASKHRQAGAPQVKFDDSKMNSSYANVCNISFTREEVLLLFGMSDAWQSGQSEVNIQLTQRIILSPFAAKRMHVLLGQILRNYEQKFSSLAAALPAAATSGVPANPAMASQQPAPVRRTESVPSNGAPTSSRPQPTAVPTAASAPARPLP